MSWRTKAGVALAAVVLAPVAVELVIQGLGDPRRREMEEQARKIPGYWDLARAGILLPDDEAMRFRLRPGFAATVAGIEYRVNERGLRGGPLEPAPRPGTRRVLVGGDSYAFGLGVTEREALPVQLEEQLRRAARDGPDGDPVEVVNFGVPAYQTGQELALLERLGFALAPDLVVLLYYANDNVETALSLAPSIGALYVDELPLPHAWKAALSRSYLYSRIARLDAARRDARGDFDPRGTRNWPVTAERLRRYAAACRRHGVAFLLAPLPELSSHRELDDDASEQSADHARVIDLARVEGWPVVDLRAGLRGSVPAIERLFLTLRPRDVHLNPEGHRLVAELLAPEVRRLLRRRRPRRRAPAGPPRGELRPGSMVHRA